MFKHILMPTDGSTLSDDAIHRGMQFARSINAKVTGIHVIPPYTAVMYGTEMLGEGLEEFEKQSKAYAERYLGMNEAAAKEAGVSCTTLYVTASRPYEAIIKTAEEKGCDLIVMASHGRRGVEGLLIGSETTRVLTHTKLPVLVYR